jgi:hypothetical protein
MNDIRHWIRLVENATSSITAYHASPTPIVGGFHAFSHFGTLAAAQHRLQDALELDPASRPSGMGSGQRPVIYEVILTIRKPLMIDDGWQDAADEAEGLKRLGHVNSDEAEAIASGARDAYHIFAARGYDAYVYRNDWEDAGSLSYIPFRADQIKVIHQI